MSAVEFAPGLFVRGGIERALEIRHRPRVNPGAPRRASPTIDTSAFSPVGEPR